MKLFRRRFELLTKPPRTVEDLASALGVPFEYFFKEGADESNGMLPADPMRTQLDGDVGGVSVGHRWDMYHQSRFTRAAQVREAELLHYTVFFRRGLADWEARLHDLHGEPHEVAGKRRYGDFFVHAADAERFELEWHLYEPDWAKPPPAPDAAATLAARIRAATDPGTIQIDPPVPAQELLAALGHPDALAQSFDVHMTRWVVPELTVGERVVEVGLKGWPTGGLVAGVPGMGAHRLGAEDKATRISWT